MDKVIDLNQTNLPSVFRLIKIIFISFSVIIFLLFSTLIYISENEFEKISLEHWLRTESDYFTKNYTQQGEKTPPPNAEQFDFYWSEQSIPAWLNQFQVNAFYEHMIEDEDKHFIVSSHPSGKGKMYIIFKNDMDDFLDGYESELYKSILFIGLFLFLCVVLIVLYFIYVISRPFNEIIEKIKNMPPNKPIFIADSPFYETRKIETSLLESKITIDRNFTREQEVSRFTSHELKTPISVIQASIELLAKLEKTSRIANKAIVRIQNACTEMHILTETFLLIGKNEIEEEYFQNCSLSDILIAQVIQFQPTLSRHEIKLAINIQNNIRIKSPAQFIIIIIQNLMRNAIVYGDNLIKINVSNNQLTMINTIDRSSEKHYGYGCGLVIIERICEKMNWHFKTQKDEHEFSASITFISPK